MMKLSRGVSVGEETQKYLLSDHQFVCLFVFFLISLSEQKIRGQNYPNNW